MTLADIEQVYDALAQTLDVVGPDKHNLLLAKLALLLANDVGDLDKVITRIRDAAAHLDC